MEPVLTIIASYTGIKTQLPLVCKEWRDILYENRDSILSGLQRRYSEKEGRCIQSISEILYLALSGNDKETIRLLTTECFIHIPLPWDNYAMNIHDADLSWYFSFRISNKNHLDLLRFIYDAGYKYRKNQVQEKGHQYTVDDIVLILNTGLIDKVWTWMNPDQRDRTRPIIEYVVRTSYYYQSYDRISRSSIIYAPSIPFPTITIPWLCRNGFLPEEETKLIQSIMQDDINEYHSVYMPHRYEDTLSIIAIFHLMHYFNATKLIKEYIDIQSLLMKSIDITMYDDKDKIVSLLQNSFEDISFDSLYKLWRKYPTGIIRDTLYSICTDRGRIDMIDIFLDEYDQSKVIIDSIRYGMYPLLYNLLKFRGINAGVYLYYSSIYIDPKEYILPHLLLKKNAVSIPTSIDDWHLLCRSFDHIKKEIDRMTKVRASLDELPHLLDVAIRCTKNNTFIVKLVNEHKSDITPEMVKMMRTTILEISNESHWIEFKSVLSTLGIQVE